MTRCGPAENGLYAKNGGDVPRADPRASYFSPHPVILKVPKAVRLPLQDFRLNRCLRWLDLNCGKNRRRVPPGDTPAVRLLRSPVK
jgi:hypothetical protein